MSHTTELPALLSERAELIIGLLPEAAFAAMTLLYVIVTIARRR